MLTLHLDFASGLRYTILNFNLLLCKLLLKNLLKHSRTYLNQYLCSSMEFNHFRKYFQQSRVEKSTHYSHTWIENGGNNLLFIMLINGDVCWVKIECYMCVAFDGQLKTTVFISQIVHDVNFQQQQKQRTEKSGANINTFTSSLFPLFFSSSSSLFYCKNNKNISISLSIQIRILAYIYVCYFP